MSELIMVTNAEQFKNMFGTNSNRLIKVNQDDLFSYILGNHQYLPRDEMEKDSSYKQIISYCLVKYKDKTFVTKRTKKQSESRLHFRYSIGIGGHLNYSDETKDDILLGGMKRELFEELKIECKYQIKFLGLINDDSSEVNSVHAGLCFLIDLDEEKIEVNEVDKMEGFFVSDNELINYYEPFERWSEILFDSVFGE